MGRIVVGVDGSDNSARALSWAIEEATLRNDDVEAVTVWHLPYAGAGFAAVPMVDPNELQAGAAAQLEGSINAATDDDAVRAGIIRTVSEGGAAGALMDAAKDADLLVVGSRGHGGFVGLLLGSVSSQCVHHARCPVVVVPPADEASLPGDGTARKRELRRVAGQIKHPGASPLAEGSVADLASAGSATRDRRVRIW